MRGVRFTLVITLLPLVWIDTLLPVAALWKESYFLNYNYELTSREGPESWSNVSVSGGRDEWTSYDASSSGITLDIRGNECGYAFQPSPLHLVPTASCPDDHELYTRKVQSSDCTQNDITFQITPYSLRAYYPTSDRTCQRPAIKMSGVNSPFVLVWMELHARAEHVVDGRRYDAELQMVHLGPGNSDNQVAIVSVLVDASGRKDNPDFQWLLDQWQNVADSNASTCSQRKKRSLRHYTAPEPLSAFKGFEELNLKSEQGDESEWIRNLQSSSTCKPDRFGNGCEPLVPRLRMYPYILWPSIWYFGYSGSINYPPCSPIVAWRVIDIPLQISRRQFKQLSQLLPRSVDSNCKNTTAVSVEGENFRPVQSINNANQDVYHCTIDNFSFAVYTDP